MASYGPRHQKRKLYTKDRCDKGKLNILKTTYNSFEVNDKIAIIINPSHHKGTPHFRYQGLIGFILGKRGNCFLVNIPRTNKLIITNKHHLKLHGIRNTI